MDPADRQKLDDALAAHRGGRPDVAAPVYADLLERYPDAAELHHLTGILHSQAGRLDAAEACFRRASELDEAEPKYLVNLGVVAYDAGRLSVAEAALERALALDPSNPDAAFNLGNVRMAQDRLEEAAALYRRTLAAEPDEVGALNNLGGLLKQLDQREQAVHFLRRAVVLDPGNEGALVNLVDTLERLNLTDEAAPLVERLLAMHPDHELGLVLAARLDRRAGRLDAATARLERLIQVGADDAVRCRAWFDLGKIRDGRDDTDGAFQAFLEGNALSLALAERAGVDPADYRRGLARDRAWFTAERLRAMAGTESRADGPAPVFLVGFPRSGTTLVEQMLDAHPGLITTGERSPLDAIKVGLERQGRYPQCLADATEADLAGWRERFWTYARDISGDDLSRGGADRRLADKMPFNITCVGMIARLFPDARVVVSLRDPRDACLSAFMQHFAPTSALMNFTDLEKTVALYEAVMGGWLEARDHLPVPWMEYRYEDLVAEFEGTVGGILGFLGLPWDDAIRDYRAAATGRDISTPSYENVVEPLYGRAIGRWRRYRDQLSPYLDRLAPFVEAFGYVSE